MRLSACDWSVPDNDEPGSGSDGGWREQALERLSVIERLARLEALAQIVHRRGEHVRAEHPRVQDERREQDEKQLSQLVQLQKRLQENELRQHQQDRNQQHVSGIERLDLPCDLKKSVSEFLLRCKHIEALSLAATLQQPNLATTAQNLNLLQ